MRRRAAVLAVLASSVLATAGCSGDGGTTGAPEPSPSRSIRTLTALPMPSEPPPTGRFHADMRQSSRDAAAGRMEVWIDNDTAEEVRPRRIAYVDPRYRAPLRGTRLRPIPSQSERGFPLYLPRRPACDHPRGGGSITLTLADGTARTLRVADETDVAGRYARARCTEIAIAEVATLTWSDDVPGAEEQGDHSTLTLLIEPTGRAGATLTIDTISGTPVLSPVGTDVWRPEATITGTDPPSEIELPLKPTRCDAHAFAESGGATAFKIGVHLDGRPGQITLRMSESGAARAITFAKDSCGDLLTMS